MGTETTNGGVEYDPARLEQTERRFWGDVWGAVPEGVAAERGVELRRFGPVQASVVGTLPGLKWLNLVLGAAAPGAVSAGHLAAAAEWVRSRGITPYVAVTPGLAETAAAEAWLGDNGFSPSLPWMKFVRDAHPPRFAEPGGVEVVPVADGDEQPFGAIAAAAFELPAWAADFFARLPANPAWRCYVARVDGTAQGCGAMLIDGELAELGFGGTLEAGRRRGCQLALLRRRILDAAEVGCRLLAVETGARVEGQPARSYRNILRAGFEEAYLRPNWAPAEAGEGLS